MTTSDAPELAGRVAVVTGASSGIGRAIALELAAAGADVLVHARRSADAAHAVAAQIAAGGCESRVELCDLSDQQTHQPLVEAAFAWRGSVDIWINNAGVDVLTGAAAGWPFEQKLAALWPVDVVATMRLTRLAGTRMKARGRGAIVNIGWDQAAHGMAGDSGEIFAAVKGAVMAFTRSAAQSLAPQVRVNCIAPGWIRTAWGDQASEAWQERAAREALLARWGAPEDVARVARFLCSSAADFVTGQVLDVNGGLRRG